MNDFSEGLQELRLGRSEEEIFLVFDNIFYWLNLIGSG